MISNDSCQWLQRGNTKKPSLKRMWHYEIATEKSEAILTALHQLLFSVFEQLDTSLKNISRQPIQWWWSRKYWKVEVLKHQSICLSIPWYCGEFHCYLVLLLHSQKSLAFSWHYWSCHAVVLMYFVVLRSSVGPVGCLLHTKVTSTYQGLFVWCWKSFLFQKWDWLLYKVWLSLCFYVHITRGWRVMSSFIFSPIGVT